LQNRLLTYYLRSKICTPLDSVWSFYA